MKLNNLTQNRFKKLTTVLVASSLLGVVTACSSDEPGKGNRDVIGSAEVESADNIGMLKPADLPQAMLSGHYDSIYSRFSTSFKAQVSEADFSSMASDFTKGVENFGQYSLMEMNGMNEWVWLSQNKDKGISAIFDENDRIIGLQIRELSSVPETDERMTKIVYELPFRGEWLVFWGGSNVFANYHYEHASQRYAYDFIQTKDGISYNGDPSKNESYIAFGQDVLAPADGTVVTVINNISDNEPVGVMNEKEPAGNVVIIDHGGEYSILAHLKKGSVSVKPGDEVKRGERLGALGNSGNSSEAHLHFQVSDGKDLFDSRSINVHWKDEIKPVRGETITAGK